MSGSFTLLADLLTDAGSWRWWTEALPKAIQLEFIGSQLAETGPSQTFTPMKVVALRFGTPSAVAFVRREGSQQAANWHEELRADRMEPLPIWGEKFRFNDPEASREIIKHTAGITWLVQPDHLDQVLVASPVQLAFHAGEFGVLVCAEDVSLVGSTGVIPLDEVERLHKNWWDYWKLYWKVRATQDPLAYDPLCEVILPVEAN